MSMIGYYRRITSAELAALEANPDLITDLVYPKDGMSAPAERWLDLDKSWHAIHFLLNGDAWGGDGPLFDAVLGGEPLLGTDLGYGPARVLRPAQVEAVVAALGALPFAELESRFDLTALAANQIYPSVWHDRAEEIDYLRPYYAALVTFFAEAAYDRDAMILYIG